jgi:signal transduction histidine kinase
VELMGGEISVSSQVGVGTQVHVQLLLPDGDT